MAGRLCRAAIMSLAGVFAGIGAAAAEETPLPLHIHYDTAMFQVLVSPGRVGTDAFVLQLMSGDGTMLRAKAATLTLSRPDGELAPLERTAALGPDGYWHVADVPIPRAGRWHVRIDAVTAFRTITLEEDLDVPAQ